jgi:N-acetylmuramoyl-L-alanine amidase
MQRRSASIAACVCAATLALAGSASAADRFDTVVLDAGHGGEDTGAKGASGTLEKDLVLRVARALQARLKTRGLRVVMTRSGDVFVPLEERTMIANDARGDLFVSIHANAAEDPEVGGTETYFLALSASDESAEKVAARENQAFGDAGSPIAAVNDPFIALIGDLIATEHLQESSLLAREIQSALAGTSLRSRGVKQALFVVLNGVQMPASLVEIGFVTSTADEATMRSGDGTRAIVDALERAILAYGKSHAERLGAEQTPAKPAAGAP